MRDIKDIIKEVKKIKFKKAIIVGGLSIALGSSVVACNRNVKDSKTTESTSVFTSLPEVTSEPVMTEEPDTESISITNKVLEEYSILGRDLLKEDLGCIKESAPYLFKTEEGKYVYDTTLMHPEDYGYKSQNYNKLYVLVDKTRNYIPIAGIARIDDKIVNVNVKAISTKSNGIVRSDSNHYIDIKSNEEQIKNDYNSLKEYYKERLEKVENSRSR